MIVTLKPGRYVRSSPGAIVRKFGLRSLDSLLRRMRDNFSSAFVISCLSPEKRVFKIVFQSPGEAEMNVELIESNEHVQEAKRGFFI